MKTKSLAAALAFSVIASSTYASDAQKEDGSKDEHDHNYLQVMGGFVGSSSASLNANLGNGVQVPGNVQYDAGSAFSVVFGRQFYRERERDESKRKPGQSSHELSPWRLELEWWNASAKRREITLAARTLNPGDRVRPKVLFLNVALPIAESDERVKIKDNEKPRELGDEPLWRWWLGAGVGLARTRYPGTTAVSGCDCLRATSDTGLAFQLKLIGERRVAQDIYLFGQLGAVRLPKTEVTTVPGTSFGTRGVGQVLIGLRFAF